MAPASMLFASVHWANQCVKTHYTESSTDAEEHVYTHATAKAPNTVSGTAV